MVVKLTAGFRIGANETVTDNQLKMMDVTRQQILDRLRYRLILLSLGGELRHLLQTPTGGIVYGKLLYGGVKRFRLINNSGSGKNAMPRRAAERTVTKASVVRVYTILFSWRRITFNLLKRFL